MHSEGGEAVPLGWRWGALHKAGILNSVCLLIWIADQFWKLLLGELTLEVILVKKKKKSDAYWKFKEFK